MDNQAVYRNRKVCTIHFEAKYSTRSKYLSVDAVPTLHMSESLLQAEQFPSIKDISEAKRDNKKRGEFLQNISLADTQCEQLSLSNENETVEQRENAVPGSASDYFSWNKDIEIVPLEDEDVTTDVLINDDVTYIHDNSNEDTTTEKVLNEQVHENFQCNICEKTIAGFRYVCLHCPDYDICSVCETRGTHALHYMLRVPGSKPFEEVQSVLESIRRHLFNTTILSNPSVDITESIKPEVKEELEEVLDPLQSVPESTSESTLPAQLCETTNRVQEQQEDSAYELPMELRRTVFESQTTYVKRKRKQKNETEQDIEKKPRVVLTRLPTKCYSKVVLKKKCLEVVNTTSNADPKIRNKIEPSENIKQLKIKRKNVKALTYIKTSENRNTDDLESIENSTLPNNLQILDKIVHIPSDTLLNEGRGGNTKTILISPEYFGLSSSGLAKMFPDGATSADIFTS